MHVQLVKPWRLALKWLGATTDSLASMLKLQPKPSRGKRPGLNNVSSCVYYDKASAQSASLPVSYDRAIGDQVPTEDAALMCTMSP